MLKRIFSFIEPSLEEKDGKTSSTKLTALWFVILVTILHLWWLHKSMRSGNFELLPEVLYTDCATIITLLGLKVWEKVKYDQNTNQPNTIS